MLIFSHVTQNPASKKPDTTVLMGYVKKLVHQVRKHDTDTGCAFCVHIQGARVAMRREVRCELKESSRILWIISIPQNWVTFLKRVLSSNINHTKWKVQHNPFQRSNLRVFSHIVFFKRNTQSFIQWTNTKGIWFFSCSRCLIYIGLCSFSCSLQPWWALCPLSVRTIVSLELSDLYCFALWVAFTQNFGSCFTCLPEVTG